MRRSLDVVLTVGVWVFLIVCLGAVLAQVAAGLGAEAGSEDGCAR
jgi:hypothetical protein